MGIRRNAPIKIPIRAPIPMRRARFMPTPYTPDTGRQVVAKRKARLSIAPREPAAVKDIAAPCASFNQILRFRLKLCVPVENPVDMWISDTDIMDVSTHKMLNKPSNPRYFGCQLPRASGAELLSNVDGDVAREMGYTS